MADGRHFYSVTVRITGDKPNAHLKWDSEVSKNDDYHVMYCTSKDIADNVKAMFVDMTSIEVKIIKKKIEDWEDIMSEEIEYLDEKGIQFRRELDMLYPVIGKPYTFAVKYDTLRFQL